MTQAMSGWAAAAAAMWGVSMDELENMNVEPLGPSDDAVTTRYCTHCWCSFEATGHDPCWQCGGETTPRRPKHWPECSGPRQLGGRAWSPGDDDYVQLELPLEEEAA